MIEANITIDRDLIIKGYKNAYSMKALRDSTAFYNVRAFFVFLAVAFADIYFGAAHLIGVHLVVIAALAIGASLYHYFSWLKQLSANAKDYELHVVLDDDGVLIKNDNDKRLAWSSYSYYKEFDDYLEITNSTGEISFLPKRNELVDVIVFTKTKIPNSEFL